MVKSEVIDTSTTEKDVLRLMLKRKKTSQAKLAELAGFKSQSNINGMLNGNSTGIKITNFYRMCDALGYDIVIRDREGKREEWILAFDADPAPEKVEPPKEVEPEPVPAAKPFIIRTKPKPVVETPVEEVKEKPRPMNGRIPIW